MTGRELPEKALRSLLLAGLILSVCPSLAAATDKVTPARPPPAAAHQEEAPIPVATDAGVVPMTQRDYDEYVQSMGHLPVMSKTYIFGQKIPLPKTDKQGHIHLSGPAVPTFRKGDQPP